ncbi:hypothetical protein GCM10027294_35380 [Marinactinospora endophytica]
MPAQGQTATDIAVLMQGGEDYIRDVIHAFIEQGGWRGTSQDDQ